MNDINIYTFVFAIVEIIIMAGLAILGWSLKTLFNEVNINFNTIENSLQDISAKFTEHRIQDAGTLQIIKQLQIDICHCYDKLDKHEKEINELKKGV